MLQHYFTYTHRLTWHGLWIILLSIIVLGLITKLVNLRIISPPAIGSHLKNPERSMPFLSNELRVGTYNIRYGKGYETPTTINQLAEVLASPALDIIAMNEVQKPVFSETSQAELIADLLDMSWLYAMTADRYLAGRAGHRAVVDDGYLVAPAVFDVTVHGVPAGVDPAVGKPFVQRRLVVA